MTTISSNTLERRTFPAHVHTCIVYGWSYNLPLVINCTSYLKFRDSFASSYKLLYLSSKSREIHVHVHVSSVIMSLMTIHVPA